MTLEGGVSPSNSMRILTTCLVHRLFYQLVYTLYGLYSGYGTVHCTVLQLVKAGINTTAVNTISWSGHLVSCQFNSDLCNSNMLYKPIATPQLS